MPDLPIVLPDTAAAPKDYTLSGTQNLLLKTVRALIDGSGAASPFLPTLQMLDPNGHVMWEGATPTAVAAGASADVSWFPGLGSLSGSSTSGSVVMPYAQVSIGVWSWPVGGGSVDWTGASVTTTDTAVFVNGIGTDPTVPILALTSGIFFVWAGIGPWNPAWGTQAQLSDLGGIFGSWLGMGQSAPNYPMTFVPVGGVTGAGPNLVTVSGDFLPAAIPGGAGLAMEVAQNSGAARNVSAAMTIIRLTENGQGF